MTDESSLVRRLERMCREGLIELEDDVSLVDVAHAFLAQPNGNLRQWLLETPQVAEVYY